MIIIIMFNSVIFNINIDIIVTTTIWTHQMSNQLTSRRIYITTSYYLWQNDTCCYCYLCYYHQQHHCSITVHSFEAPCFFISSVVLGPVSKHSRTSGAIIDHGPSAITTERGCRCSWFWDWEHTWKSYFPPCLLLIWNRKEHRIIVLHR